jgi:hypothetical protein
MLAGSGITQVIGPVRRSGRPGVGRVNRLVWRGRHGISLPLFNSVARSYVPTGLHRPSRRIVDAGRYYPPSPVRVISTRRFFARPSGVSFEATG